MPNNINQWTAEDLAQHPQLFQQALRDQLQGKSDPASEQKKQRSWWVRLLGWILVGAFASIAPFILLIRSSLWIYENGTLGGWPALLMGAGITTLLLLVYALWAVRKWTGRWTWHRHLLPVMTGIVLMFCLYGGLYISRTNTKTDELQQVYTSLHPILRIAVTTATLFDKELVITDLKRTRDDYRAMGLSPLERSLHYQQPTGYVHATDLRTLRRAEWKNHLLHAYFYLMGFHTLRHVGTADHLHISLPLPKS
jgi:hypothetical protein